MYTEKDEQEIREFWIKFYHKVHEVQQEFSKLSYENKIKIFQDAEKAIFLSGLLQNDK